MSATEEPLRSNLTLSTTIRNFGFAFSTALPPAQLRDANPSSAFTNVA